MYKMSTPFVAILSLIVQSIQFAVSLLLLSGIATADAWLNAGKGHGFTQGLQCEMQQKLPDPMKRSPSVDAEYPG